MKDSLKYIEMSSVIQEPLEDLLVNNNLYYGQYYVPFGKDNNLPTFLSNLFYESPTHASILDFKQKIIKGNGVDIDEQIEGDIDEIFDGDLDKFIENIIFDFVIFDGFCFQVVYNKRGDKINRIYHIPFQKIRSGAKNIETDEVEEYYYKEDWMYDASDAQKIKRFNPNNSKEDKTQLYYFKKYNTKDEYYPIPNYFGGLNYILLEKDLSIFYKTVMNNTVTPNLILKVNSIMDDDEKKMFFESVQRDFKGVKNSNKLWVIFSDGQENSSVEVEPLKIENNEKLYNDLNEIITNKIITTHKVPKSLLSIDLNTGFSSNADELLTSFQFYNNTFIKNYQNDIIKTLKKVLKFNYEDFNISFKKYELIKKQFSENLLSQILTQNELRAMMGYEPLEENNNIQNNGE